MWVLTNTWCSVFTIIWYHMEQFDHHKNPLGFTYFTLWNKLRLLLYVCFIQISSLVRDMFVSSVHWWTGWFVFLLLIFKSSLYSFRYKSFIKYMFFKYFLPLCGLPLHFLNSVFFRAEAFNYNKVKLVTFSFMVHTLIMTI